MSNIASFARHILWGIILLSAGSTAFAGPPEVEWVRQERGVSIALDNDDHVYILDYEYNPASDMYLKKYTTSGDSVWTVRFDQTDNTKWEQATWVTTDQDNNIIVTGTLKSGYSNPVNAAKILMKFDPDGNLLWRRVFESDFDGTYTKKCLVDKSNNIYVFGTGIEETGLRTIVKKFKPNGDADWIYYDSLGIGAPHNFKFSQDSSIVITGRSITGSINGYAKINLSGQFIWAIPGINSITTGDIAGDLSGNSYIINDDYDTNEGSILSKVSPTGEILWTADAPLAGFRVEVGKDQYPVISGFQGSGTAGVAMMKWDADGIELWRNLDADGPVGLLLHAKMLLDDNDNAYLAAGNLFSMGVCKVNADGTSGWTLTVGSGNSSDMVIDRESSVFVVGGSTAKINQDDVTAIRPINTSGASLKIYPQPATAQVLVQVPVEGNYAITLRNLSGQIIRSARIQVGANQPMTIQRDHLPAGMYVLTAESDQQIFSSILIFQ